MSSNYKFYDYHKFDEKKIQFKRPIVRDINCEKYFFIPIRSKNREIYIKTPKIVAPFGLNIYITESNEKYYYYVISFTDADIDPNIEKFYHFLRKIEEFCKSIVKTNLIKWGCEYLFESLNFKSCFKENESAPLFRLKITHTGKQLTELYDELGQLQEIEDIESHVTQHCQIISLIELNNIWINSTEYGVTWKVHQMRVYPSTRPIGGVSLLDENIVVHTIKIIEEEHQVISSPPDAPPLDFYPPPNITSSPIVGDTQKVKIPKGGVSMLPFLSSISEGGFKLKKVNQSDLNKYNDNKKDDRPKISLLEILKIRQNLKKKSDNDKSTD